MLSEKIQEIQTSVKRMYRRFMTLTAVVVFGAIAIAQAQRGDHTLGEAPEAQAPQTAEFQSAKPIPLAQRQPLATRTNDAGETEVVPVAAEYEIPAEPADAPASEGATDDGSTLPSRWGRDTSAEETASSDNELTEEPPAAVEAPEAAPLGLPGRRNPYRSESREIAPVAGDESTSPADEESTSNDEAPPLLEDANVDSAPLDTQVPAGEEATEQPAPEDEGPQEDVAPVEDAAETEPEESTEPVTPRADSMPTRPRFGERRERLPNEEPDDGPLSSTDDDESSAEAALPRADHDQGTGGKPGPQSLEGPQVPTLTLEKLAPPEIQVGRPAKFQVRLRNTGRVPADGVVIRDEVPAGTNLIDTTPKASTTADGAILWEIGTVAPGQEVIVGMQLMPVSEGQIGSVATVAFQASASARTRATKPELVLEHTGPAKVLVGETVRFAIKLSNPGTGTATQVVLEEDVPEGLSHSSGPKLEYEVGSIQPGQTRTLELTLKAAQAGHVTNLLMARADNGLQVKDTVELEVVSPKLQVTIDGPARRYLDRQATFTVSVANPGTADARDVELSAQLPAGLKFVSTNNSGYYDQARHAVIWSLEQLPAGEMGKAQFQAMPIEMGDFQIRAEGRASMGLEAHQEHALTVEGIAALLFGVADKVDPIEVNGQTTYEIRVVNQGSKPASNVRFVAIVPDGMRPVGAEGPTAENVQGQQVIFAPIDRLPPKEQATFRITVEGTAAGDHRFRVQMQSDEIATPVIKEESTHVYAD